MPSKTQYDIVKQQCNSMIDLGYPTRFEMQPQSQNAAPKILVDGFVKSWRFSDPDWDVVSKQLATLYVNLKRKRC